MVQIVLSFKNYRLCQISTTVYKMATVESPIVKDWLQDIYGCQQFKDSNCKSLKTWTRWAQNQCCFIEITLGSMMRVLRLDYNYLFNVIFMITLVISKEKHDTEK